VSRDERGRKAGIVHDLVAMEAGDENGTVKKRGQMQRATGPTPA